MHADDLVVFKYEDQGVATLEDGLYVVEDKLKDPAFVSHHGEIRQGLDEGLRLGRARTRKPPPRSCSRTTRPAPRPEAHQVRMMGEINKLTEGSDGTLDTAAAERTVDTLMKGGSDPVITKKPEGAWTSAVTDAMKAM